MEFRFDDTALQTTFHGANESNDSFFNALSAKRTPSQAM